MQSFYFKRLILTILSCAVCFGAKPLLAWECGQAVLQVGWFAATQKKSKHVDIDGLIGDKFHVKKSSDQNVFVGLGYYFQGAEIAQTSLLYGINAFYLAPTKTRGHVIQENRFDNLSFHYSRTNYPIYFATRALIPCFSCYDLVLDVGIGPNIIRTHGFKERACDRGATLPDSHLFASKTTVDFSATVGLGCRVNQFCGNISFEIAYRFFYLGEGKLKKNNNQLHNTLKTGTSYGNALCFTLSI